MSVKILIHAWWSPNYTVSSRRQTLWILITNPGSAGPATVKAGEERQWTEAISWVLSEFGNVTGAHTDGFGRRRVG
jgi:hypothetical protein